MIRKALRVTYCVLGFRGGGRGRERGDQLMRRMFEGSEAAETKRVVLASQHFRREQPNLQRDIFSGRVGPKMRFEARPLGTTLEAREPFRGGHFFDRQE